MRVASANTNVLDRAQFLLAAAAAVFTTAALAAGYASLRCAHHGDGRAPARYQKVAPVLPAVAHDPFKRAASD